MTSPDNNSPRTRLAHASNGRVINMPGSLDPDQNTNNPGVLDVTSLANFLDVPVSQLIACIPEAEQSGDGRSAYSLHSSVHSQSRSNSLGRNNSFGRSQLGSATNLEEALDDPMERHRRVRFAPNVITNVVIFEQPTSVLIVVELARPIFAFVALLVGCVVESVFIPLVHTHGEVNSYIALLWSRQIQLVLIVILVFILLPYVSRADIVYLRESWKGPTYLALSTCALVMNDITLLNSGSSFHSTHLGLPFGHSALPAFTFGICALRRVHLFGLEMTSVVIMMVSVWLAAGSDMDNDTLEAEGFAMTNALCLCGVMAAMKRNASRFSAVLQATLISLFAALLQTAASLTMCSQWEATVNERIGIFGWLAPTQTSWALALGSLQLAHLFALILSLQYLHTMTVGITYTVAAPLRHLIGSAITPLYIVTSVYIATFFLATCSIAMALYVAIEYRRTVEVEVSRKPWRKIARAYGKANEQSLDEDDNGLDQHDEE